VQQTKPIFYTNPLRHLINGSQSGTIQSRNLNYLNKLFEMMKDAIFYDSEQNRINYSNPNNVNYSFNLQNESSNNAFNINSGTHIFQTIKSVNKPILSIKGQKIFNIVKKNNHSNKRSVKIIYTNNEENNENSNKYYNVNNANYEYEYRNHDEIDNDERVEKFDNEEELYEHSVENYNTQGEIGEENFEEENKNDQNDDYFNSYSSWKYIFK